MYAVLCPLKSEFKAVMEFAQKQGYRLTQSPFSRLHKDHFLINEHCFVSVGGHGKVNFAIEATNTLSLLPQTETLICLGAAGSLNPEVKVLDVVAASVTLEHDYKQGFLHEGIFPQVKGDSGFLEVINKTNPVGFSLHSGIIASGDEDITSQQRANELVEKFDAQVVAWEGIGGAKVARRFKKKFIEIRGVTDFCHGEVTKDFQENLKQAIFNASEVLFSGMRE